MLRVSLDNEIVQVSSINILLFPFVRPSFETSVCLSFSLFEKFSSAILSFKAL